MNMAMLRNIQGLHAPLKLTMERQFASKVYKIMIKYFYLINMVIKKANSLRLVFIYFW